MDGVAGWVASVALKFGLLRMLRFVVFLFFVLIFLFFFSSVLLFICISVWGGFPFDIYISRFVCVECLPVCIFIFFIFSASLPYTYSVYIALVWMRLLSCLILVF